MSHSDQRSQTERQEPPLDMGPAILFCPGNRPERFVKAAERSDAVILDLEDAVAPEKKEQARASIQQASLDPRTTIVRVNSSDSGHLEADLTAVRASPYRTIMLAKAESADVVARTCEGLDVIALCETPLGVVRANELAALPTVIALMWGAEDLVAATGGTSSRTGAGHYRDVARYARAHVLLAAKAHGKSAIDAVHLDIADESGLRAEAADASASGFDATACIHPTQVAAIRAAYAPSEREVQEAIELLAAVEEASEGVFQFRGKMIDEPVVRHARAVVDKARRSAGTKD